MDQRAAVTTPTPPRPTRVPPTPIDGMIISDKPAGWTSAAVVAEIGQRIGVARAGHTGTLDPAATGVLPICLGNATKLASALLADEKEYLATITLGVTTDTLDSEGEIIARDDDGAAQVDFALMLNVLARFVGPQRQIPPRHSALKIDGRRAHELERQGEGVDPEPRDIVIHNIELISVEDNVAVIRVACSKGTYIRSLARDLGVVLGCGAHLAALQRTRSGRFTLADAIPFADVHRTSVLANLIALRDVTGRPSIEVGDDIVALVMDGARIPPSELGLDGRDASFQLLARDGRFIALARTSSGRLIYERVFRPA